MIDISLISFCVSIFDNAIVRYLLNIPVLFIASTTHLPTFCDNYTGISKTYWIKHTDECHTLFTNIIYIHTTYFFIIFVLFCCCFRSVQNILLNILNKNISIKTEITNSTNRSVRGASPAAIKGKETRLKNICNEKFGNILYRLFKALENIKLPKAIHNCIRPFQEEYAELKKDLEERLTGGNLSRFSSIQSEN